MCNDVQLAHQKLFYGNFELFVLKRRFMDGMNDGIKLVSVKERDAEERPVISGGHPF